MEWIWIYNLNKVDNFCYLPIHLFPSNKWDQTLIKVVKIKGTVMGLDTGILNFSQIMGPSAKKIN